MIAAVVRYFFSRYLPFPHHLQAGGIPSLFILDVPMDAVRHPAEPLTVVSFLSSSTLLLLTPSQPVDARGPPRRTLYRGRSIRARLSGALRAPFSQCTRAIRNALAHLRRA